jgi:hypothetical protein
MLPYTHVVILKPENIICKISGDVWKCGHKFMLPVTGGVHEKNQNTPSKTDNIQHPLPLSSIACV